MTQAPLDNSSRGAFFVPRRTYFCPFALGNFSPVALNLRLRESPLSPSLLTNHNQMKIITIILAVAAILTAPAPALGQRTDWQHFGETPAVGQKRDLALDSRTVRLIDRIVRAKADSLKSIANTSVSTLRDVNGLLAIKVTLSGTGMPAEPNVTGYNAPSQRAMQILSLHLSGPWAAADIFVDGHTDNVGPYDENMTVSFRRAMAIGNLLIRTGVDSMRVIPRGFSYDYPIADNHLIEGREANRRVEVTICVSPDMLDRL